MSKCVLVRTRSEFCQSTYRLVVEKNVSPRRDDGNAVQASTVNLDNLNDKRDRDFKLIGAPILINDSLIALSGTLLLSNEAIWIN